MTKPKYERGRRVEGIHDLIDCIGRSEFIYPGNSNRHYHPEFLNNWGLSALRRLAYNSYVERRINACESE